ncbi:MAG: hypothetical protein IOD12_11380, partial [Silvanigrellales bacterium]|nr:hypothetical protein [Silvanigrellales bacterium]
LPLSFRYGFEGGAGKGLSFLVRASHVLEDSGLGLAGVFDSSVAQTEEDLPAAIARVTASYFRAPLESMLEQVPPDVLHYPGNFLVQPVLSVRQAGVLRIVSSRRPEAWVWQLSLEEGNATAVTTGETSAHVFQGRGRDSLRGFFSHFDALALAFEDYITGGQDIHVEWGVREDDDALVVFRWRESPCPDPGIFDRERAAELFPTALTPLAASVTAHLMNAAQGSVRESFPLALGADRDCATVTPEGWVFVRKDFLSPRELTPSFRLAVACARLFGERASAWVLSKHLRKLTQRWCVAQTEHLANMAALEAEFTMQVSQGVSASALTNNTLVSFIDRMAMLASALARFGISIHAWRAYVETTFDAALPLSHLETASGSLALMKKSPLGARLEDSSPSRVEGLESSQLDAVTSRATLPERLDALDSGLLTSVHALCVLMDEEIQRCGADMLPLARRLMATCAARVALENDDIPFLSLWEIQAQLQLLDENLHAAGVAQPRLEHRARLRRARHEGMRDADPATSFVYAPEPREHEEREDLGAPLAGIASDDSRPLPLGQGHPVIHLHSERDIAKLFAIPEGAPKPFVVTLSPFPWLVACFHRMEALVSVQGNALCHLATSARKRGLPAQFGDAHAFERYPESAPSTAARPSAPRQRESAFEASF